MKNLLLVVFALLLFVNATYSQVAAVTLRPAYIDISSATSESAVLMTLSSYSTDDVRYRLYNGSNQYNCWNPATNTYISSTSYTSGPQVPGTPSSSSTWWILSQRGNNTSTIASYRDRLGPGYGSNFSTVALPTSTAISSPFNLNGKVVEGGGYDLTVKYVVLGFDQETAGNLLCATSTELTSGDFILICHGGTTIKRIEIRSISNTIINSITNASGWTTTTTVTDIPLPVDLAYFNAFVKENKVTLKWGTNSEINNAYFELFRINNSVKTKIGRVNGNGTTNEPKDYIFNDPHKLNSGTYHYQIKQVDNNGNYENYDLYQDVVIGTPVHNQIENYPNPFNPKTIISFSLTEKQRIKLRIYDLLGRQVSELVDGEYDKGYHSVEFDGSNISSGMYFYVLFLQNETTIVKKMTLVK